jgi:diguanylate cyclase (GGDEF)-like protein
MEMLYLGPTINAILDEPDDIKIDSAKFVAHIHPDDQPELTRLLHESADKMSSFRSEYRLVSSTGVERWVRADATPRRLPGGETVWDGFALEITDEKAARAELTFLESHDRLTGLSNRARFRQALALAIEALSADESVIGVILLGIDDFQDVNDSLGHPVGDEVLRELGRRLTKFIDNLGGSGARLGGDEFALLIPAVSRTRSMEAIAAALNRLVAQPITVGGHKVEVEASIGVAIFPQPNDPRLSAAVDGCAELMKQADLALQAAKRDDRGGFRVFTPDLDDRFRNRIALRSSMAIGIANRQFELHYQPIVTLATGAVVGAEALVRWNHPTLGLQAPGHFIPIAEASGLIAPLGEWIVNEAFRQGQTWRAMGLGAPRVAINISSLQLRRSAQLRKPGFVSIVERALARSSAEPGQFEFELTETVLIDSSDETVETLRALKAMGFSIAIDDFGTGHSTFRYLRDFPVDRIKIDRSFVSRIGVDQADESIIRAMVSLARSLGVSVVGEGIETVEQLDFLRDVDCALGQGYLFSMPLKAEDFAWMLERNLTLPAERRAA